MLKSSQHSVSETQPTALRQELLDEQDCWERLRMGDEAAFTKLATLYYRQLAHYGSKFTPNKQLIEDALQDLLIHIWLHRATINPTSSVKFYLMKAFRHQLFKSLKQSHTMWETEVAEEFMSVDGSVEEIYIQFEQAGETQAEVYKLLNTLPVRQREVLYLRYYQELSTEEIAQLLSIKPQSVSNIVQRSLAKLRQYWPNEKLVTLLPILTSAMSGFNQ